MAPDTQRPVRRAAPDQHRARASTSADEPAEARRRRHWRPGVHLLMLPCLVMIAVLVLYPMTVSLFQGFHKYSLLDPTNPWVGLANYRFVAQDPNFVRAAANTGEYLLAATAATLVIGLVMALWLHSLHRGRGLALVLTVLPWAVPGTVTGIIWSFILNPTGTGLLNAVLMRAGVLDTPVVWLGHALPAVLLITLTLVWQTAPIAALIIFAALQSIPAELDEAARVDGAGPVQYFWSITMPLLRPGLAIALLNAGVTALGIYDQIYVLAGASPATQSVVGKIYTYSFRDFHFGFGIAASVYITLATALLSLFYLKVVYREVVY